MVDEVLQRGSAARQRAAMELQFADEGRTDSAELGAWRQVRRESVRRQLSRTIGARTESRKPNVGSDDVPPTVTDDTLVALLEAFNRHDVDGKVARKDPYWKIVERPS